MTIGELKEYIFEQNKIEYILEKLGCHNIKYNEKNEYFSACFPDGDNPKGVNIRNNKYLNYWSWSRNVSNEDKQDLISLIEYINKCSFIEAVKYLHDILGLKYSPQMGKPKKEVKKFDPLAIFKNAKSCKRRVDVGEIQTLDESVLDEYMSMLHIDFYRDGIMPWTRKKFGLMYSNKRKRMVIPHRYWLTGELLGSNMRTMVVNYKELGIPKYILTNGMDKSINLYGLYENYNDIKKRGYVVVAEGERSVLKRDSLNDPTLVALSGKVISDEQVSILIGLNVEIVIMFDKDVDINEIRHACEKFYRVRKVSYMYDKWDLLDDKDSPADARNKVYEFLFKRRTIYDEAEHKKYLESLKR